MEGFEDTTMGAADILKHAESHGSALVDGQYRPMRGQAYVEMLGDEAREGLVLVDTRKPSEEKWHRGRVLALGDPSFLDSRDDSPVVPWDCAVGDEVVFNLFLWLDSMRTLRFPGVKGRVMVVGQVEISGVVER